jgi:hypothetical protein
VSDLASVNNAIAIEECILDRPLLLVDLHGDRGDTICAAWNELGQLDGQTSWTVRRNRTCTVGSQPSQPKMPEDKPQRWTSSTSWS